jgi:4a-hydroxytetrahydrobiopterin dehydratase
MEKLSHDAVRQALESLPGWKLEGDVITRTYVHADFRVAIAHVNYVAEVAEKLGHHPDVDVRYNEVRLAVTTHDAGGLTAKDLELARTVDAVG